MTNGSTATDVWRFAATGAELSIPPLCGEISLDKPDQGITRLNWNDVPLAGQILGVSAGPDAARQDAFEREQDLVAVYAESHPLSFTWQVYWRATMPEAGTALIDVIISLQTPLLESFPEVTTHTLLPDGETHVVAEQGDCILLRPTTGNWSYAEMTHPKDRGTVRIAPVTDNSLHLERHLGGQFLEKGVIRLLRLRGAFLPRDKDLQLAARCYEDLATERPPLTA